MVPSSLSVTYILRPDAPGAMLWDAYETRVRAAWSSFLCGEPTERQVQSFLERHPALVPGAHLGMGRISPSGHSPFPAALVTQPALTGLGARTPDFVWLAGDSATFNPLFIEIEAPAKPWLTKGGQQHNKLTHALQQLSDWESWFNSPVNRQLFFESYHLPTFITHRKWQPVWVLIYGRQEQDYDRVTQLRSQLSTNSRVVIPYDHIAPDPDTADYLCVKLSRGRYVAVSVPPTLLLGPHHAEYWAHIHDKPAAVKASSWLSPQRKAFLIERFPYWDDWARDGGRGLRRGGDRE